MKDHFRSLPFALALTVAPLAHGQATTVFDSTTTADGDERIFVAERRRNNDDCNWE